MTAPAGGAAAVGTVVCRLDQIEVEGGVCALVDGAAVAVFRTHDDQLHALDNFDPYAGHSWASGHGAFAAGQNQESSSEAINFASAVLQWGEVTGRSATRDLGTYLYATEVAATEQYWFDV